MFHFFFSVWKTKVRKLLNPMQKVKLEECKLFALVLEGNSLPFTSRLKDFIKTACELGPSSIPDQLDGGRSRKNNLKLSGVLGLSVENTPFSDSSDEDENVTNSQRSAFEVNSQAIEPEVMWPVALASRKVLPIPLNVEMTSSFINRYNQQLQNQKDLQVPASKMNDFKDIF